MLSTILFWILLVVYVLLLVGTSTVVVLENQQPAKTIAWLIVLICLPVVGMIFFYFFGQNVRHRHIVERRGYEGIADMILAQGAVSDGAEVAADLQPLARLVEHDAGGKPTAGNRLEVIDNGKDFLQLLLRDIYSAKEYIHLETYIIADDGVGRLVRDALIDKAKEGLEVRLLYDDVGCWKTPDAFFEPLLDAGVQVAAFLPVRFPSLTRSANYRNHRKVCVIDCKVGYVGGMNIALRYVSSRLGVWRDMHLRARGPLVGDLQRGFLQSWFFTTNMLHGGERYLPRHIESEGGCIAQISVSSPVSRFPSIMYSVAWMAQNAKRYLYLQTPYFMPPTHVLSALQSAALAGIDVRLMLPEETDTLWLKWANESYCTDMLRAGVKVYLYRKGFLHAKALVMDDVCCQIGTANLDFRSFENNFETNAVIYDKEISCKVKDVFFKDMEDCLLLDRETWEKRSLTRRWIASHVRILSPLL